MAWQELYDAPVVGAKAAVLIKTESPVADPKWLFLDEMSE